MSFAGKLRMIVAEQATETIQPVVTYEGVTSSRAKGLNSKEIKHKILARVGDKKVGILTFIQLENMSGGIISPKYNNTKIEKCIYIENIKVSDAYRKTGVGSELLKVFGEVYNQNFANWPVSVFYMNPIAEYAFRKAVSQGYIPDYTLDENWIERDEDVYQTPEGEQLVKDLRGKLPKSVQGPEVWARRDFRKITAAETGAIQVEVGDFYVLETYNNDDSSQETMYQMDVKYDNSIVGWLCFTELTNFPVKNLGKDFTTSDYILPHGLYIEIVEVRFENRKKGIAELMYKKFGEVYNSKYNGLPVLKYYMNPVAEYAFKKAVADGYLSENALTEEWIRRNPIAYADQKFVNDLRGKLPKGFQGPEVWAKRDFRKILAISV